MRLSMIIDPGRSWAQMLTLARQLEESGWYAAYTCDHFMPYDPDGQPLDGPVLECWTTLTGIAAHTSTIRVGSLVLSMTYRHPAVVASMAATLDHVSGGRLILGVGAGWQVNEHRAYGLALPAPRERIHALDEACTVITGLLRERRTTFAGESFRVEDAPSDPKPLQSRLPLLVGGGGERYSLKVAARHADVWHAWTDPDALRRKGSLLDGYCADIGRDPRGIQRASGGTIDPDATGGSVVDRLQALRDAGADEFIVIDDGEQSSFDDARRQIDLVTRDALPRLA